MDETTLKLLKDFAAEAQNIAEKIKQPPRPNAVTFLNQELAADNELRDIWEKITSVANAIDAYAASRSTAR